MSEHRTLDRLLLPRVRAEPPGAHLVVPETHQPLPRWQTLPLDAKFPVTPAAKGQVTFVTTKICHPAYVSNQKADFDLSDPYNRVVQSEYQPLSDPHLKKWLAKPYVKQQLAQQNLVTPSGNIPCTVRDFNHYRNYLRRQALMMNRTAETASQDAISQATEKRRHSLEQIKVKAELLGVEMKCKGLKAQQMQKEAGEEKHRQFLKKQAAEEEREQRRLEEEARVRAERVAQKRVKWLEKQSIIKSRQEEERRHWQKKSAANELETLHKFSVIDNMKFRREWLLERRRKQQWELRRQLQLQSLEETKELQRRVELDKEVNRQQYQVRMKTARLSNHDQYQTQQKSTSVSQTTAATVGADPQDTSPQVKEGSSCGTDRTSLRKNELMPTQSRKEREINVSRKTSMWIIEETLYNSGLHLQANSLFSSRSPQVYSRTLDHLIGTELDRNMKASVLGELQDSLSQVIHDIVRQVLAAHQDRQQSGPDTDVDSGQTNSDLRFHQVVGKSLEVAGPVRVSMCAAVSTDRNHAEERSRLQPDHAANQPDNPELLADHRATLFHHHIRRSESDVFAMETELTNFMTLLQESDRDTEEERKILELFLQLVCNETLTVPNGSLSKKTDQTKEPTHFKDMHLFMQSSSELGNCGNAANQTDDSIGSSCRDNCNLGSVEVTHTQEAAASSFMDNQPLLTCRENQGAPNDCPHLTISKFGDDLSSLATNEHSCFGTTSALCGDEMGSESQTNFYEIFPETKTSPVTDETSPNEHQPSVNMDDDSELRIGQIPAEDMYSQMVSAGPSCQETNRNRLAGPDKPWNSSVVTSDLESMAAVVAVASVNTLIDVEGRVRESSSGVSSMPSCFIKQSESCQLKLTISDVDRNYSGTSESCQLNSTVSDVERNDPETSESCHLKPTISNVERNDSEPAMNANAAATAPKNISFNNSQHPPSSEDCISGRAPDDQSRETGHDQVTSPLYDDVRGMRPEEADVIQVTARFLQSLQLSERLQGLGFPPSKICHVMTGSLSRLWNTTSGVEYVTAGWWDNSRLLVALQGLLNNVKMMKFPPNLVHILNQAIATTLLQQCSGNHTKARKLPEYLTSVIHHRFFEDLTKKEVNEQLLEVVLWNLCEEYANFVESDVTFMLQLFLCKTLAQAQTFLDQGEVSSMDFTRNILNFGGLAKDQQHLVLYSLWRELLLQTRALVQLSSLTPGQIQRLGDTLAACCKKLNLHPMGDLRSCIQKIEAQTLDHDLKLTTTLLLTANLVVAMLPDIQYRGSTSVSLLSVALMSPSVVSSGILDRDTTGEAVVLLVLDSLAREIGDDNLDRRCLVGMVTSLAETLSRDYGYRKEDLTWDQLTIGLECMTSRFRTKSLEFQDSCKIISAILKPYLAFVLSENKDEVNEAEVGPMSMDEDLLSSLFSFLTEVYVTLVRGVIARVKVAGVKVECDDDSLVSSVWRIMACLAIEARKLLSDQNGFPEESTKCSKPEPKLDALALEGLAESFGFQRLTVNWEDQGGSRLGPSAGGTSDQFLVSLTSRICCPGYMPAPELTMAPTASTSDLGPAHKAPTAIEMDMALRREVIRTAGQINCCLLTDSAREKMEVNMADMATGTVVVLERFTGRVLETMEKLQGVLTDRTLTPTGVAAFLQVQGSNKGQAAAVSADMATNKVLELVLELKFLRRPLLAVRQVTENVASMCRGLSGLRGQAALCTVRPHLWGSLMRGLMMFTLKGVAWLLHCVYVEGTNVSFSTASFPKLDRAAVDAAFMFIQSNVDLVRKWPDREKNSQGLWAPKPVSGNPKEAGLLMPYSVRKFVHLRLAEEIDSLGKELNTTATLTDKTPRAADVATFILHEVLSAVSCHVEQGQIPLIRLGDLFEPERWKAPVTEGDKNSTFARQLDSKQHPLAKLEQEESRVILQRLVTHLTGLGHSLKQNIKAAVRGHEAYDCLLQASAFTAAKLDRVKQDLAKHIIVIAQPASQGNTRASYLSVRVQSKAINGEEKDKDADLSKGGGTIMSELRGADENKLSVCQYVAKLFHYLTEARSANEPHCNLIGVIKELLKACYSVDGNMLRQKGRPGQCSGLEPVPVLVMEAIINELFNRLDDLEKARIKELDKDTNYPYLFSRIYTRPDPWGPYYSDVAIRARQLTDSFRAGLNWPGKKVPTVFSVMSSHSRPGKKVSAMSSVMSSGDGSGEPEHAQAAEVSSLRGEVGTSSGEPRNRTKKPGEANGRGRISSWRQRVKDTSTSHSAYQTVTAWVSRGGRLTRHVSMSKIDNPAKKNTTGQPTLRQRSFDVSGKLPRTRTGPEHLEDKRTDDTGNNLGQVNQDGDTQTHHETKHNNGSTLSKETGVEDSKLDLPCSAPKPLNKQSTVGNDGATIKTNNCNKSRKLNVTNIQKQCKPREIDKTKAVNKDFASRMPKETKKVVDKSTARHTFRTAKKNPSVQDRINRETSVAKTWPRVVHIIHHAYADQHNQEEKHLLGSVEGSNTDHKVPENSHTTPQEQELENAVSEGHNLEEVQEKADRVNSCLLVSMLRLEMPREMSAVQQMFGESVVSSLGCEALVGVLAVCDTVVILLSLGERGEALSFLEGGGRNKKVSQRVAGAVNNILRSVMSDVITDQEIIDLLASSGEESSHVNVTEVRGQLTARLSALVELVEDGCPVPGLCQGRGAEMLEVLTGLCQNSHSPRDSTPSPVQDNRELLNITENRSYPENSVSCGASSASSSSRDTDRSFSLSDNESNDDKCAMSSSWTILSSCPSLSSSRSSNAVQGASFCSPGSKVLSHSEDNGRQPLISRTFDDVGSLDAEDNAPRHLSGGCSETENQASCSQENSSKSSGSHTRSGDSTSVKRTDRSQSRSTGCNVDQSSFVDQSKRASSVVSTKSAGCPMVNPVRRDSRQRRSSCSLRSPSSASCSTSSSTSSGHNRHGSSTSSHRTQPPTLSPVCPDLSASVGQDSPGQSGTSRNNDVGMWDKCCNSRQKKPRPAKVSISRTSPAAPDTDHQHPRSPRDPQNNTVDLDVDIDERSSDTNDSTLQDGYLTGSSCGSPAELEVPGSDRSDSGQDQRSPEQGEHGIDSESVVSKGNEQKVE